MKYLAFLLLLVFPFIPLSCQSAKKKIERLQTENDSLRLELQKCQNAPMQRLTETLDSPKFGENPNYGREELHAKLLPQIKAKSEEKYGKALNIIISTDAFLKYCEALKTELTQQTGGVDANGQPIGARDNKTPTRFFIEEKRGAELKAKMEAQRAVYINAVEENQFYLPRIVLQVEPLPGNTTAKTWEEFKFKGMPLMAVFPIIGKIQSDAKASEAAVLQFLNE